MRTVAAIIAIAAAIIVTGIVIAGGAHTIRQTYPATIAPAPAPSPVVFTGPLPTYP